MTGRRTLTTLLAAGGTTAALIAGALAAPAHAANNKDVGSVAITKAAGRRATCAKAAKALIVGTQHDYYMKRIAFTRIRAVHVLGANVTTTDTLPSGAGTFTVTDKVRCIGKANRRGTHGSIPIWFSLTYAPDFIDTPLPKLKLLTHPPASTYSVNYQTALSPGW